MTRNAFVTAMALLGMSVCSAASAVPMIFNEVLADPESTLLGDANGDGVRDATDDEFVELVNVTGSAVDISGWTLSDAVGVRHTFDAGTIVAPGTAVVVFGGGTPTGSFGGSIVDTASSGALSLNNSGDTITLNDGLVDIDVFTYGGEGGDNTSLTRNPDGTGLFEKHDEVAAAGGALFSPGTKVDGTAFVSSTTTALINEVLADPPGDITGDANGDGTRSATQDEFVEIVNTTAGLLDISGFEIHDGIGLRHVFGAGTVLGAGQAIVVFGGGTPTGDFGGSLVQTASSGALGLNNGGDDVLLFDGLGVLIDSFSYGSEGSENTSLTRDPDVLGAFDKHDEVASTPFSAGTRTDGSRFVAIDAIVPEPATASIAMFSMVALLGIRRRRSH